MLKNEYIALKNTDINKWTYAQCVEADKLIKKCTIRRFEEQLRNHCFPKTIVDYLMLMVEVHFGSVETDQLLITMKAYPDWM